MHSAQPNLDRRTARRERCVLRCEITHGLWKEVSHAVMRDLHEDGARLRLTSRARLSGRVTLRVQHSGQYIADVVWQRGDELGVRLIATLDETVERQIEALKVAATQLRQSNRRPVGDDGY